MTRESCRLADFVCTCLVVLFVAALGVAFFAVGAA